MIDPFMVEYYSQMGYTPDTASYMAEAYPVSDYQSLGGSMIGGAVSAVTSAVTGALIDRVGAMMGGNSQLPAEMPSSAGIPGIPNIGTLSVQSAPACPPRYHLRKKMVAGRPACVKRRRMNPLNPAALRRSTTRLVGFQKAVKTVEKALTKACRGKKHSAPRRTGCSTCGKGKCSCR